MGNVIWAQGYVRYSIIMVHGYDDIALLVACVDIAVSLGNLFQGIASINDRFYLVRLKKLF